MHQEWIKYLTTNAQVVWYGITDSLSYKVCGVHIAVWSINHRC